jgi:hypothetical protein
MFFTSAPNEALAPFRHRTTSSRSSVPSSANAHAYASVSEPNSIEGSSPSAEAARQNARRLDGGAEAEAPP